MADGSLSPAPMRRVRRPATNAVVLYTGPSLFDGSPIVVIATGLRRASKNEKTGAMIQTWILRQDEHPAVVVASGIDGAVCGTCPHRAGSGCYVNASKAPSSVWSSWRRGRVPLADESTRALLRSMPLRIGSYGDPGAVPLSVWASVTSPGQRRTGYTHAWKTRPDLAPYAMASVDSAVEGHVARAQGWRTFRVIADELDAGARPGEIECLSESKGRSCADCGLCHGKGPTSAKVSIWITAHGSAARKVGLRVLQ